ncbi:MAG: type 1 glutamine amidotransferase [Leptospiraceae bacterium]|nr:type 1 glutamine amidotransferase [Leptospiraceae bacterium]MCK6380070.1 type 1 glutamine amidotransferase [Leptospiraceae bacterium]
MRSLIVRFINCEGPGIIEEILRKENYSVTYHDTFKKHEKLVPNSHLFFDLLILMGGPYSLADNSNKEFFHPYFELVENMISIPSKKIIGVCLGGQLISKVLGGDVSKGEKGIETGFSKVQIQDKSDFVFNGINQNSITAFHLHENVFTIPKSGKHLLSGGVYPNQMFSYEDRVFGIQCHLEPTMKMVKDWSVVHKDFIGKSSNAYPLLDENMQKETEETGKIIFQNMIRKKK